MPRDSALDAGARADQKYRYRADDASGGDVHEVHHYAVRTHYRGEYYLRSWRPGQERRDTTRGPAPLRTALRAAAVIGDGLPR